jgi:hypothetical protein
MEELTKNRVDQLRQELDTQIADHRRTGRFDSFVHQGLIIGAAFAGFVSLIVGLVAKQPELAGIIGALPSIATILTQQLHCVKAQNWHARFATELAGIRTQLLYELKATASDADVAALAERKRTLEEKMTAEWEKVTTSQPTKLADIKPV